MQPVLVTGIKLICSQPVQVNSVCGLRFFATFLFGLRYTQYPMALSALRGDGMLAFQDRITL
jgi:hypothetical protein